MAHSADTKEVDAALAVIRPEHTGVFDSQVFGLLAEINQFRRLREEKVTGKILDHHLDGIFTRAKALSVDWHQMKSLDIEMEQAELKAREAVIADESQRYRDQDNEVDRICEAVWPHEPHDECPGITEVKIEFRGLTL